MCKHEPKLIKTYTYLIHQPVERPMVVIMGYGSSTGKIRGLVCKHCNAVYIED